jgi:hypothetical protein
LEEICVDEKIILKYISKEWHKGMDWIDQVQDRDRWLTIVNVVMNIRPS